MMNSPAISEIYATCYGLLLIAPFFIGRFSLRPSIKLRLTRILFLACIISPIAVRAIEPPRSHLMTNFISSEGMQENGFVRNNAPSDITRQYLTSQSSLHNSKSENYKIYACVFWMIGMFWCLSAVFKDLRKIRSILRNSWLLRAFGRLKVRVSDQCEIPFSVRTWNGAYIVLPISMLDDPQSVKMAIAHEGQHHRQGDCLFAYLLEAIKAMFFWNPGIWQWERIISELQEFSCDEALVGHRMISAHDYGRCLLKVAQTVIPSSSAFRRELACAVGMSQGVGSNDQSMLRRRIAMFSEYQSSFPKRMLLRSVLLGLSVGVPICAAYAARGSAKGPGLEKIDTGSLDPKIQRIAADEITAAVKRYKAKSGAIAVADAKSGRILAFAEKNTDNKLESWASRPFAPASTIKPFVAAAAIENGLATAEKTYDCRQPYIVGGEKFVNYEDRFSDLSVTDAISQSVNVCLIKIGQEVGLERLKESLNRFGFDTENLRSDPTTNDDSRLAKLTLGETLPVSMATMLKAYSILANNGHRADAASVVSESTARSVQRILVEAVNNGTGKNAALPGRLVGGKTGTLSTGANARPADLDGSPFFGLFGGYVPSGNSQLVAFVLIEDGHRTNNQHEKAGGGVVAAPVFHEVMKKSLDALR